MKFCHQRSQILWKSVHLSFMNDWKRFCARSISVWYRKSSQMKNSAAFFSVRSELKPQRIANFGLCAVLSVFSCVKSLNLPLSNVEIKDFSRIQLTELGVQRTFLQKSHFLATFPKFLAALKARNSDFFSVFFVNPGDFHETRSLSSGNLSILSPPTHFEHFERLKTFLRAKFYLSSSNFCLISQKSSDEKILQRFFCSITTKTAADCKLWSLRSHKRFFLREISEFAAVERRLGFEISQVIQRTFFCRNLQRNLQLFQSFRQYSKPVILTFFLCFFWILATFTKLAVFLLEIWEFCHNPRAATCWKGRK